ncbi:substrate-binding periplasmic protein [Thalassospira australica]|uniref:substrate-binding periplasmic protein n=1 Tax=Thalassospira australica TaxID=1528106 RepID=UPI0012E03FBD|nr:transporter substrate-binding domain-containing protein [Thalassospira australica]
MKNRDRVLFPLHIAVGKSEIMTRMVDLFSNVISRCLAVGNPVKNGQLSDPQQPNLLKTVLPALFLPGLFLFGLIASSADGNAQNSPISPAGQQPTITLACNPFPPSKIASERPMPGYDVEVLRAAFAGRNITVITPFYPWRRAYFLARTGQVDGLCSCSYLPERDADFLFSDTLGYVRVAFYATQPEMLARIETIEDASNLTVGVVNGYSLEATAKKAGLDVLITNSEATLVDMLRTRRIDVALSFKAPMDHLLSERAKQENDTVDIAAKLISESPYYSCITRKIDNADAIMDELNKGLATVRENGLYDAILDKYGLSDTDTSILRE